MFMRLSALVLIGMISPAYGATLPRGRPPEALGPRVSVVDYGADPADSDHDDTRAVSAAIAATPDPGTVFFPAGVYNVRWVKTIRGRRGLSLVGEGRRRSIVKRMGPHWREGDEHTWDNLVKAYGTDPRILWIEDCADMCIRDLGFDAHGTPTFGGVNISRPRRLHITRCRIFDSQEQPPLFGRDRFGFILLGFATGCRDVWFTENLTEGLQTEMDSVRRVLVEHCVFRRSVKSPGLGFLSGNFANPAEPRDGFINEDITVRHNVFTNSRELSMGMVTLQLDPATNRNSVFRRVDITDNEFIYNIDSPQGHPAIKLGAADSSLPNTGNVFTEFRIERNRILVRPSVAVGEEFPGYIWFNCWAGTERLTHSVVRGNVLYADGPRKPLVHIERAGESEALVVEGNEVRGARDW